MENQINEPESAKWQLGVLRNIQQEMTTKQRRETQNWQIVRDYFLFHTNKSGRTCSYKHCEFLEIDPEGYSFY